MAKILTVDDSASMRAMVSFTLSEQGHEVVMAENGQLGLDAARLDDFSLVISDVNMPVMDGITFITELRREPNYSATPNLMLTTEFSTDMKMAAKKNGGNRLDS